MHDSANSRRRSIARLVQGDQVTLHQSGPAEGFWDAISPGGPARPAIKARTGSQFPNGTPRGNYDPEFELETGCGFPNRPLAENASRNSRSKRDALSQSRAYGKLRPTLKGKTGTQFPGRASKTKLRWNSSCLGLQPAKTRTISPQLMRAGKMPALATKCHLRGLGGHSQRHVTETHIGYGMPSSTDKRCPTGLPSNEACHSLRRSARCRQSADTAK